MLSYETGVGWEFDPVVAVLVCAYLVYTIIRDTVRKRTLRQTDDGTYVWIEWHGGERCSDTDPSEAGGLWDSEGGDGDGGD